MSHRNEKHRYHGERDCRRDHLYAQRLNNVAALCIESGQHDKAVAFLVKALCLSPTNKSSSADQDDMGACPNYCSLDECIAYSEERAALQQEAKTDPSCGPKSKKRKIESSTNRGDVLLVAKRSSPPEHVNERSERIGYTHKRPILVTPTIIHEGHIMGPILSLIITFNLALANHLNLIEAVLSEGDETCRSTATRERLGKVLRLYELAYQWEGEFGQSQQESSTDSTRSCSEKQQELRKHQQQVNLDQSSAPATTLPQHSDIDSDSDSDSDSSANTRNRDEKCSSLRFDMIVCNNLSQIHRMAQNYSKQEKCLQHLLSILMFVVDWQRERGNSDDEESIDGFGEQEQQQQLQEVETFTLDESNALHNSQCATIPAEEPDVQQQQQGQSGKRKRSYMDLDGFWRNISPFLLKNDCADAA